MKRITRLVGLHRAATDRVDAALYEVEQIRRDINAIRMKPPSL